MFVNRVHFFPLLSLKIIVIAGLFFPALSWAGPRIEAVTLDLPYVGRYHVDIDSFSNVVAPIAGMRVGVYFSEKWGMEFYDVVQGINGSDPGQGSYDHLIRLEGDRHFHYGKWVPFLAFGGGGVKLAPRSGGDFIPVLDYGGGLKYFFWKSKKPEDSWRFDSAALRLDLRLLHVFDTDLYTDFEYTVGLHFVFRPGKKVEALSPSPPLPPRPSPPPPPVVGAEEVVQPALPRLPVVPPAGLPRIIYFDLDRAAPTREGEDTVQEIARWLRENPTVLLWIRSHTDQQGTNPYNEHLGGRRAWGVMRALVALGISRDRLFIDSAGEEQLVCLEQTERCHALNRRLEWGIVP